MWVEAHYTVTENSKRESFMKIIPLKLNSVKFQYWNLYLGVQLFQPFSSIKSAFKCILKWFLPEPQSHEIDSNVSPKFPVNLNLKFPTGKSISIWNSTNWKYFTGLPFYLSDERNHARTFLNFFSFLFFLLNLFQFLHWNQCSQVSSNLSRNEKWQKCHFIIKSYLVA